MGQDSNQHSIQDDFFLIRAGFGHPPIPAYIEAIDRIEEQAEALQRAVDDGLTVFVDTLWETQYRHLGSNPAIKREAGQERDLGLGPISPLASDPAISPQPIGLEGRGNNLPASFYGPDIDERDFKTPSPASSPLKSESFQRALDKAENALSDPATSPAEFEVVDVSEAGLDAGIPERKETETHYADGSQKFDEFGAPIKLPVKVRDGVRDTRVR